MTCRIENKKGGGKKLIECLKRGRAFSNKVASGFGGGGGLAATFLPEKPLFSKNPDFFSEQKSQFYQP